MSIIKLVAPREGEVERWREKVCQFANTIFDVPEYADNAAAVTGGLVTGQIYRTGDALKIVHA